MTIVITLPYFFDGEAEQKKRRNTHIYTSKGDKNKKKMIGMKKMNSSYYNLQTEFQ